MNRRAFIKNSAIATSASMAFSPYPLLSALQRTEPYKVVLIGSGWWGMNILNEAIATKNVDVLALCDVDQNQLKKASDIVQKSTGKIPKGYTDYRECIKKEQPEIVIVGTPDHWHALPTIAAIKSGAHVYVEKPIGHTIAEGRAILNAARKYERVVQVGTHRRVSPHNISAMEFLRSGKVGDIHRVHTFVLYDGGPGTPASPVEVPEGLDWDMWCGPAPLINYRSGIHPKGFRQYLDYANGTMGDWGIHWFDQVLWWTDEKYPKRIYSTGDRFVKEDGSTAPDNQMATFEFEDFTLTWEHRLFAKNYEEAHNIGCYFYGTKGTLHLGWLDGWTFYPKSKDQQIIQEKPTLNQPDQQNIKELWADFINAIEQKTLPACDIEKGHLATNISLLGMISYKLGRSIEWNGEKEKIIKDIDANSMLKREYRGDWKYPV